MFFLAGLSLMSQQETSQRSQQRQSTEQQTYNGLNQSATIRCTNVILFTNKFRVAEEKRRIVIGYLHLMYGLKRFGNTMY